MLLNPRVHVREKQSRKKKTLRSHWKAKRILFSSLHVNMNEQSFTLLLRSQGLREGAEVLLKQFKKKKNPIVEGQRRIAEFQLRENKTTWNVCPLLEHRCDATVQMENKIWNTYIFTLLKKCWRTTRASVERTMMVVHIAPTVCQPVRQQGVDVLSCWHCAISDKGRWANPRLHRDDTVQNQSCFTLTTRNMLIPVMHT